MIERRGDGIIVSVNISNALKEILNDSIKSRASCVIYSNDLALLKNGEAYFSEKLESTLNGSEPVAAIAEELDNWNFPKTWILRKSSRKEEYVGILRALLRVSPDTLIAVEPPGEAFLTLWSAYETEISVILILNSNNASELFLKNIEELGLPAEACVATLSKRTFFMIDAAMAHPVRRLAIREGLFVLE
ncbi:MAG: hypothetical protein COT74_06360 [Bdellovibrionales bacterium CG10_big_fil_rev_8_21_14_0_10_45_34]|nr:MAG: hypothetical protein COT74_06360 [Bdellovibrionales bacterium CG10_big_fil_rev_8_21_14_0_10_45_34]